VSAFIRGARVACGARKVEGFDVDASGLYDAAVLFSNLAKRHNADPDFLGRAVVGGEPFAVQAVWRASHSGRRGLKLRFTRLREPPPRKASP
jgi:hypothetical protein